MSSWDKPSSTGDGKPDRPGRERRPDNLDLFSPYPRPYWDRMPPPPSRDRARENDERAEAFAQRADRITRDEAYGETDDTDTGKQRPDFIGDPDKPKLIQADASNESSEKTESTDKTDATDKDADRNADKAKISELQADLAESNADRRKLIDVVSSQHGKIERLESENDRLEAELAEKEDKPAEQRENPGDSASDALPQNYADGQKQAEVKTSPDRPWYKQLPSEKAVGLATAATGTVEAVAVSTGRLPGSAEAVIGAFVGLGVAGLAYAREKHEKRKNADKPED